MHVYMLRMTGFNFNFDVCSMDESTQSEEVCDALTVGSAGTAKENASPSSSMNESTPLVTFQAMQEDTSQENTPHENASPSDVD